MEQTIEDMEADLDTRLYNLLPADEQVIYKLKGSKLYFADIVARGKTQLIEDMNRFGAKLDLLNEMTKESK